MKENDNASKWSLLMMGFKLNIIGSIEIILKTFVFCSYILLLLDANKTSSSKSLNQK